MIRLEISGHKLGINFAHHKKDLHPRFQRLTVCTIFNLDGPDKPVTLATGRAACSTLDQFRRDVGRKLALKRALCQHDFDGSSCSKCGSHEQHFLELSHEARTQLWLGYFDAIASKYPEEPVEDAAEEEE